MLKVRQTTAPKLVRFPDSWAKCSEKGDWGNSDLISWISRGWEDIQKRFRLIDVTVVPKKPASTLQLFLSNAVQKFVGGLCLKRDPRENVLHASRSDKVNEPRKKKKEDSFRPRSSFRAAIQASVTAFGEETYARIRRMKETQQRRHRPFREKDVPGKVPLLGLR